MYVTELNQDYIGVILITIIIVIDILYLVTKFANRKKANGDRQWKILIDWYLYQYCKEKNICAYRQKIYFNTTANSSCKFWQHIMQWNLLENNNFRCYNTCFVFKHACYVFQFKCSGHQLSKGSEISLVILNHAMGFLPDTQDWGLRMRGECQERFPHPDFKGNR